MRLAYKFIYFIFIYLNLFSAVYAAEQPKNTAYFLTLSDIHFDPFVSCYRIKEKPCPVIQQLRYSSVTKWQSIFSQYDKTHMAYGLDTNYPLLTLSLREAAIVANQYHPGFVIIFGDFLGHDFRRYYKKYARDPSSEGYQQFVNKTLQFITEQINKTFPNLDVYAVVGNNDTYQRNYTTKIRGEFLRDTAVTWSTLINNPSSRVAMQQQFSKGGFYAVDLPGPGHLRLITLNSVMFSHKALGKNIDLAAKEELIWLRNELMQARKNKQQVILAMHIPASLDIYITPRIRLFTLAKLWKPAYTQQFKLILNEFAPQIVGVLSGHLHTDWSQVLTVNETDETFISGVPSVSPVYRSDPGLKLFRYTFPPVKIEGADTFFYPLHKKTWEVKSFYANNGGADGVTGNEFLFSSICPRSIGGWLTGDLGKNPTLG